MRPFHVISSALGGAPSGRALRSYRPRAHRCAGVDHLADAEPGVRGLRLHRRLVAPGLTSQGAPNGVRSRSSRQLYRISPWPSGAVGVLQVPGSHRGASCSSLWCDSHRMHSGRQGVGAVPCQTFSPAIVMQSAPHVAVGKHECPPRYPGLRRNRKLGSDCGAECRARSAALPRRRRLTPESVAPRPPLLSQPRPHPLVPP